MCNLEHMARACRPSRALALGCSSKALKCPSDVTVPNVPKPPLPKPFPLCIVCIVCIIALLIHSQIFLLYRAVRSGGVESPKHGTGQEKRSKKAHVLKDGALSMIVFGFDEASRMTLAYLSITQIIHGKQNLASCISTTKAPQCDCCGISSRRSLHQFMIVLLCQKSSRSHHAYCFNQRVPCAL